MDTDRSREMNKQAYLACSPSWPSCLQQDLSLLLQQGQELLMLSCAEQLQVRQSLVQAAPCGACLALVSRLECHLQQQVGLSKSSHLANQQELTEATD